MANARCIRLGMVRAAMILNRLLDRTPSKGAREVIRQAVRELGREAWPDQPAPAGGAGDKAGEAPPALPWLAGSAPDRLGN